jgi:hypothetical protein
MNATQNQDVVVNVMVKPFSGQRRKMHRCMVSPGGTVRVWDSVAGHYTLCHSLSASDCLKAQSAAKIDAL